MELTEKVINQNGITFHFVPTKKFKTVNIVMKCKSHLDRTTITKRALLPYILEQGTKTYPSEKALMLKLDELYGAVLTLSGMKKGNEHILHFQLEVANQRFIKMKQQLCKKRYNYFMRLFFSQI